MSRDALFCCHADDGKLNDKSGLGEYPLRSEP